MCKFHLDMAEMYLYAQNQKVLLRDCKRCTFHAIACPLLGDTPVLSGWGYLLSYQGGEGIPCPVHRYPHPVRGRGWGRYHCTVQGAGQGYLLSCLGVPSTLASTPSPKWTDRQMWKHKLSSYYLRSAKVLAWTDRHTDKQTNRQTLLKWLPVHIREW